MKNQNPKTKKNWIILIAATVIFFISLFVCNALVDDRILSKATFSAIIVIELLVYLSFLGYLLYDYSSSRKKALNHSLSKYDATMHGILKHTNGLPLAQGVLVDVYYGPEKIVLKKDRQEFSIAREKITSIDVTTGKNIKTQQISGAVMGKYVLGGTTGAILGSLAATTTYLVISYVSDGKAKFVILDTNMSGTFALKLQKDFVKTNISPSSSIEL